MDRPDEVEIGGFATMIRPANVVVRKKLKLEKKPTTWGHHRGGWGYVVNDLLSQLCAPDGVLFVSEVGMIAYHSAPIREPWVGVVHQTPNNNYPDFPDLRRMVENQSFRESLKSCLGLYTLCSYCKESLQGYLPAGCNVTVCSLPYPCAPFDEKYKFSMQRFAANKEPKVLFIGEFMRNYQAFFDLEAPPTLRKVLIKASDVDFDELFDTSLKPVKLIVNDSVEVWNKQVSNEAYDELLSQNVVFLNMFDAGGCTTLVECAFRGTPILVNRLPAHVEFLGEDYPLFYDSLEEAAMLLANPEQLAKGSSYLLSTENMQKKVNGRYFLECLINSSIYRSLPLPPSQATDPKQTKFPQFKISLILVAQDSGLWVEDALKQIAAHPDCVSIQVIVWNCGAKATARTKEILQEYPQKYLQENPQKYPQEKYPLHVEVISSSDTYPVSNIHRAVKELCHSKTVVLVDRESVVTADSLHLNGSTETEYYLKGDELVPLNALKPAEDENHFDVCLVMCQWKRVQLLPALLKQLAGQKFKGRFQLIIWNNNVDTQDDVAAICQPFVKQLNLELIQSTRNYYCSIRFAAKDLIKSELMLIIDDDNVPYEGYIQRFVDKYHEYGPRAVICCRGHVFRDHTPNPESPHEVWEQWEEHKSRDDAVLKFYNQSCPDCQVHFIHADNCLLPRGILREALSTYSLPIKEFILVDDYFLSFVLSHHMGIEIWRVKADDVMEMHEEGDNHKVALFHNSHVREARIDCYLYHLKEGWPRSRPLPPFN